MFMDERPLATLQSTQGWNMHLSQATNTQLKKPPMRSPASTLLHSQPTSARPPLISKTSSSSSLGGLEQNVPPFQAFLLRTPPLQHDPDKPLPPTPSEIPAAVDDWDTSSGKRSSSVYSQTLSHWAPDSTGSWQTEDLEEIPRIVLPSIAYSVSVPDLKSQDVAMLEPRAFSPLLTSPTMSTLTVNSSPESSRPATTQLLSTEMPHKKSATISLDQAKETLHAPGAKIMLPEELRAQASSKSRTKSQGHLRLTSSDIFGFHVPPPPPTAPLSTTTLVDRQGRVRSITTPPGSTTHFPDYPFPSLDNRLPSVNAFPVGTGPPREMAPPTPTFPEHFDGDNRGRQQARGRPSLDVSKYNFPASPETYVHDPYRFQLGNEPMNTAEEYHTLLAQTYRPPSPATSEYDSDDSVRRHMKMIPQPLFSSKQPARKSGALRKGSAGSRYRQGSESSMSSSGRRSNSFDLRLSMSPTDSRHTSGGSGSGFGDIPISPPSLPNLQSPRTASVQRSQSIRAVDSRSYHRDSRLESKYYPQPLQQARRMSSIKEPKKRSRPSFSGRRSRPSIASSKPSKASIGSSTTSPTLGTAFSPSSLNAFSPSSPNARGAPLLTKSVIEMKLQTPLSSPQPSPLSIEPSTPGTSTSAHHRKVPSDDSPVLGRKPFFQRVAMKSLRRANRKDSTEETRDRSPSPSSRPHPKRPELPHLGWSNDKKQEFDQAVTPPGTPTITRSKIMLLPARPMDERSYAADEPESPTTTGGGRKASMFGNVRDRFVENKAQRRREGLKKMIRVVPNVGPTEAERRASVGRSSFEEYEETRRSSALSRLSDYGWV